MKGGVKLHNLTLKDKNLILKHLRQEEHSLSNYSLANIYIWQGLFAIRWARLNGRLCIFFQDQTGCFMYLPPLGAGINSRVIQEAFKVMDSLNNNPAVSRIENIEKKDVSFYENLGYTCSQKYPEYVYKREDLVSLQGAGYKAKRNRLNAFLKHYDFTCLKFRSEYKNACLRLYRQWSRERKVKSADVLYRGMLDDSYASLREFFKNYAHLGAQGLLVEINKKIQAFTFGFRINPDTFCILYEVADLSIKGLAQFIFQQFCQGLRQYKFINVMDDSGLENLKQVKLSYRPLKLVPAYIAQRKYA